MTMKKTAPGDTGSAGRKNVPLRQWSAPSYDASTGRSVSSISEQGGEHVLYGNYAKGNAQIPSSFEARDRLATQDATPVRKRPFTGKVD